jgi:hypothetical protein
VNDVERKKGTVAVNIRKEYVRNQTHIHILMLLCILPIELSLFVPFHTDPDRRMRNSVFFLILILTQLVFVEGEVLIIRALLTQSIKRSWYVNFVV